MTAELDVVIPVHNVDRYLGQALASVVAQDADCEVWVVDGGSDRPVALPAAFADRPRIHLVRSEQRLYAGAARNRGAALGRAPWLAFLDADDIWPPGSRRVLLDACAAAGVPLAYGRLDSFHADAESVARLQLPAQGLPAKIPGGIVVARPAWEAAGFFDERLQSGEFVEWFAGFERSGRGTVAIDDVVLRRRIHVASATARRGGEEGAAYLEMVRRWMRRNGS